MRCFRIEIAGWLISQQQAWLRVDERARDSDALLLAARKLARRVALALPKAEQLQGGPRALVPLDLPAGRGQGPSRTEAASTFSSALVRGSRLKLWKTKPRRSLRMLARSGSPSCATSNPSKK